MPMTQQPGLSAAVAAQIRSQLGLQARNQADLARALDKTPNWVSRRLKGEVDMSLDELGEILGYLKVPATTIFLAVTERPPVGAGD